MYFTIKLLYNFHKYICLKHVTYTMPILMTFFLFSVKTIVCCLLFLFFSLLHFDHTICFYILVLSNYLGNINWKVLQLIKLRKWLWLTPCFVILKVVFEQKTTDMRGRSGTPWDFYFSYIKDLINNYFLRLKCLHTSIFITTISYYIITTISVTIIISLIESKNLVFIELHSTNWFLLFSIVYTLHFYQRLPSSSHTLTKRWKNQILRIKTKIVIFHYNTQNYDMFVYRVMAWTNI